MLDVFSVPTYKSLIPGFTTIATFGNPIEANLAKAAVEREGITAFLADESSANTLWHVAIAIGGIKLQVPEEDAQIALQALADVRAEGPASIDLDAEEYDRQFGKPEADEADWTPNPREKAADRAFRIAFLAFFFPPAEFYAVWILLDVLFSKDRLGRAHRRRATIAALISVPSALVMMSLVKMLLIP
jgi:Putative prokaryotic signal transducing protein